MTTSYGAFPRKSSPGFPQGIALIWRKSLGASVSSSDASDGESEEAGDENGRQGVGLVLGFGDL